MAHFNLPDKSSGFFVLPVKAAIRNTEAIGAGDITRFRLRVIDEPMWGKNHPSSLDLSNWLTMPGLA